MNQEKSKQLDNGVDEDDVGDKDPVVELAYHPLINFAIVEDRIYRSRIPQSSDFLLIEEDDSDETVKKKIAMKTNNKKVRFNVI
ncbi:hypothetical protein L1987_24780 [Smallanthus sonchifolius]|uniref:Uncharacterized protein n=1 Tax=Smallanthus sonchifolius TaxID=185202 RepID=A0ACB9ILK9_9ASTR|nr:hypothetical protein L1987_24780 [Smallanthus sonchifolius]